MCQTYRNNTSQLIVQVWCSLLSVVALDLLYRSHVHQSHTLHYTHSCFVLEFVAGSGVSYDFDSDT